MSGLRVISGSAGGRKLKAVPGSSTRPITDRAKEALFNILRPDILGASMLDLFAGTGSVGIEALSRGASFVRFIENNRRALQTVKANLAHTQLEVNAEVVLADAFVVLKKRPERAFDYFYIAPPQYKGMWSRALLALDAQPDWLVEDGWAIAQIDPKEYEELELTHLSEFDRRRYGSTMLVFYERLPEGAD